MRTFDKGVLAGIVVVVVLLVVNGSFAYLNTRQLYDDAAMVSHSHEVLDTIANVRQSFVDAETGERGFLITGQDEFLQPYEAAQVELAERTAHLRHLTSDNPRQQTRLDQLGPMTDGFLALLKEGIDVRRRGAEEPEHVVTIRRGKKQMDAIRNLLANMEGDERELLEDRRRTSRNTYQVAITSGLITTALGLGVVGTFVALVHRSMLAQQRAAALVQQQRELLRTTLASIGDAVIATDTEGRVTFLNGVAERLTGWTEKAAQGFPLEQVFQIVNEQTRQPVENPARRALQEGRIVGLANHSVLIATDGSETAIDDSAAPIRDEQGRVVGVVLVFRDITERRRAEIAKDEISARQTAVLESALDCIITMDHEGRIVEFNPAAEATFGYSRAQAIGQRVGELIVPPHLREQHYIGLSRYLKTGEGPVLGKRIEIEAMRADGSQFPVELAIARIARVAQPMFTAYLRDISKAKAADRHRNARLSISQILARASTVGDAAPAVLEAICKSLDWEMGALWIVDGEANLLRCVQVWHEQTHELNKFADLTSKTTFTRGIGLPGRIWKNKGPAWINDVTVESNFPRASVATAAGLHGAFGVPLFSEGDVVGIIEFFSKELREPDDDLMEMMASVGSQIGQVIERRKAGDALREANLRKDEFLATLAHELRNPMAPLHNALHLLKLSGDTPESMARVQDVMSRQLNQMVRLVDDLMDVSRISRGKIQLRKERIEIPLVVQAALETAEPLLAAGNHKIVVSQPAETLWIEADMVRMAQVLANLLNNAAKYTPNGGHIDLTVQRQNNDAVIRVRDDGIGIAPDMLPKVFDPFTQVDRSFTRAQGGLGIGLTLVKNLVELHDGSVEARSDGLGKGSEFIVRLPLSPAGEPRSPKADVDRRQLSEAAGHRILIVDDNVDAAKTLSMLLQTTGNEVRAVYDGPSAIKQAAAFLPDVVLLDIGMPGMDGFETAARLRQMSNLQNVTLIALTGWGQEEDRRRTEQAGFNAHLVKPVNFAALREVLASLPARE